MDIGKYTISTAVRRRVILSQTASQIKTKPLSDDQIAYIEGRELFKVNRKDNNYVPTAMLEVLDDHVNLMRSNKSAKKALRYNTIERHTAILKTVDEPFKSFFGQISDDDIISGRVPVISDEANRYFIGTYREDTILNFYSDNFIK